jgi:3D (Asp-Asp-Asp) domain-containing protein
MNPALCATLCLTMFAHLPAPAKNQTAERVQSVTATAYNSTVRQTDRYPNIGAWGDRLDQLEPGTRAIAVSPDLAARGLRRNKRVRIDGFDGEFLVLDRTPSRWRNRIDIFMGEDVKAAKRFGKKRLKIAWTPTRWAHPPKQQSQAAKK